MYGLLSVLSGSSATFIVLYYVIVVVVGGFFVVNLFLAVLFQASERSSPLHRSMPYHHRSFMFITLAFSL